MIRSRVVQGFSAAAVRYGDDSVSCCAGFFGGCSELEMMRTLVKKGPLPVGFEVYPDFQSYKGGIYRHVIQTRKFGFDPLEVGVYFLYSYLLRRELLPHLLEGRSSA